MIMATEEPSSTRPPVSSETEKECLRQDQPEQMADASSDANANVENDGARMIHLRDALRKTVKKCVDSAKFSTFNKHYGKHMVDRNPQALKSLLQQFKELLEKSIKEELELMIEEENLVPLFNELDKMADAAYDESSPVAWRPSGEPERDSQSRLMAAKRREKERLELVLLQTEGEGERLQEVVRGQRQRLARTQGKIKEHLENFSQAAEACDQVPVAELEKVLHQLSSAPP